MNHYFFYSVDIISDGEPYVINVLAEKSEEKYKEELSNLKEKATKDSASNLGLGTPAFLSLNSISTRTLLVNLLNGFLQPQPTFV